MWHDVLQAFKLLHHLLFSFYLTTLIFWPAKRPSDIFADAQTFPGSVTVADHSAKFLCGVNVLAFAASLASAEDALLAGALVSRAEANEEPCLFIFLLLLQAVVRLPFKRFAPQVRAWGWFQTQLLLYHLKRYGVKRSSKIRNLS